MGYSVTEKWADRKFVKDREHCAASRAFILAPSIQIMMGDKRPPNESDLDLSPTHPNFPDLRLAFVSEPIPNNHGVWTMHAVYCTYGAPIRAEVREGTLILDFSGPGTASECWPPELASAEVLMLSPA